MNEKLKIVIVDAPPALLVSDLAVCDGTSTLGDLRESVKRPGQAPAAIPCRVGTTAIASGAGRLHKTRSRLIPISGSGYPSAIRLRLVEMVFDPISADTPVKWQHIRRFGAKRSPWAACVRLWLRGERMATPSNSDGAECAIKMVIKMHAEKVSHNTTRFVTPAGISQLNRFPPYPTN